MIEAQTSLFDEGSNGNGLESKLESSPSPLSEKEFQRKYWTRIARIALPRFPEFQRKAERNRDVRRRLRALRGAGFSVENYSGMSLQERWNLLMSYRLVIWKGAGKYCTEIVMEIKRQNEDAIDTGERAYLLR